MALTRLSKTELLARQDVQAALAEDLGSGDLLAGMVGDESAKALLIAREAGVLAGIPWAEAALAAACAPFEHGISWKLAEGEAFVAGEELAELHGPASGLLVAERVALNFLQLMCAVATTARELSEAAAPVPVYDTRKTLPKLRGMQKYAAQIGGMAANRASLAEAAIIKDNHIAAAGSVAAAYAHAEKRIDPALIQIEVADMEQLEAALAAGAKRIMLDNFNPEQLKEAVAHREKNQQKNVELEASGGITIDNIGIFSATGVDRISSSAATKDVRAVDLSLQFLA